MELPPQFGSNIRSPAPTLGGTILPSLPGAPGPTAMTVASGRVPDVAVEGKKIPEAVFYSLFSLMRRVKNVIDIRFRP
jgi:hypothetical protein